jgi:hypothetical protein
VAIVGDGAVGLCGVIAARPSALVLKCMILARIFGLVACTHNGWASSDGHPACLFKFSIFGFVARIDKRN